MPLKSKIQSVKERARALIDELPDDCTIDDIHYQLYLIEKINRGEESLRREGGIAHDEIRKRAIAWLTK